MSAVVPKRTPSSFGAIVVIDRSANTLKLYKVEEARPHLPRRDGLVVLPDAVGQLRGREHAGATRVARRRTPPWAQGLKPVPPGWSCSARAGWASRRPASGCTAHPTTPQSATPRSHGCVRMHIPDAEWLYEHVDRRHARRHPCSVVVLPTFRLPAAPAAARPRSRRRATPVGSSPAESPVAAPPGVAEPIGAASSLATASPSSESPSSGSPSSGSVGSAFVVDSPKRSSARQGLLFLRRALPLALLLDGELPRARFAIVTAASPRSHLPPRSVGERRTTAGRVPRQRRPHLRRTASVTFCASGPSRHPPRPCIELNFRVLSKGLVALTSDQRCGERTGPCRLRRG